MLAAKELREKTDQELLDQLAMEKKRIFDATVRGASGEAIKPHEKREGKRLIAQIQTVLAERARRREIEVKVAALEADAEGAAPKYASLAAREPRPHLKRAKIKSKDLTKADRAAINLAEAKRLRAALTRDDPGEQK